MTDAALIIEAPDLIVWPDDQDIGLPALQEEFVAPLVQADAALVIPPDFASEMFIQPVVSEVVMLPSIGEPGLPGPSQIYDQATAPAPLSGYTLLWFQSGISSDPNDRALNLVTYP